MGVGDTDRQAVRFDFIASFLIAAWVAENAIGEDDERLTLGPEVGVPAAVWIEAVAQGRGERS